MQRYALKQMQVLFNRSIHATRPRGSSEAKSGDRERLISRCVAFRLCFFFLGFSIAPRQRNCKFHINAGFAACEIFRPRFRRTAFRAASRQSTTILLARGRPRVNPRSNVGCGLLLASFLAKRIHAFVSAL